MPRGGGGVERSNALLLSSSSSSSSVGAAALESDAALGGVVRADADGVVLRDGRALRFGFRPRRWPAYLLVWLNAVLLAFARKRVLPFRRQWHIKGTRLIGRSTVFPSNSYARIIWPPPHNNTGLADTSAGGIAAAVLFHLLESWIYAQPLQQLQLQLFYRPKLVPAEQLGLAEVSRFWEVDGGESGRRIRLHALVHKHRQQPQGQQPPADGSPERRYLLHFNHGCGHGICIDAHMRTGASIVIASSEYKSNGKTCVTPHTYPKHTLIRTRPPNTHSQLRRLRPLL